MQKGHVFLLGRHLSDAIRADIYMYTTIDTRNVLNDLSLTSKMRTVNTLMHRSSMFGLRWTNAYHPSLANQVRWTLRARVKLRPGAGIDNIYGYVSIHMYIIYGPGM